MKKTLFVIPIILIICGLLFAFKPTVLLAFKSNTDPALTNTIKGYLETVTNQKWSDLDKYLTGEALTNSQINTNSAGKMELTKLIEMNPIYQVQTNDFAIADVDFTTEQDLNNKAYKSRNYQRLYLTKDTSWKIYSIETLSTPVSTAKVGEDDKVTRVVKDYIESISKTDYRGALVYLTGPIQDKGFQTLESLEKVKNLNTQISNLEVKTLAKGTEQAYAKASYTVTNTFPDNKTITKDIEMSFDLQKIGENWYISKLAAIR